MKKLKSIFILILFLFGTASAETKIKIKTETMCFFGFNQQQRPIKLVLKTYFDEDIKKLIGAFVQYGTSKNIIPIVLMESRINSDGFEDYWLEIVNKSIAGEYIYAKSGVGNGVSAYALTYKNFKTNSKIVFSLANVASHDCAIL